MGLIGLFASSVVLATPLAAMALPAATPRPSPAPLTLVAEPKLFHGVGVVTGVNEGSGVVTIDHKAIPGLMDAMEMDYNARPKSLLRGLKKGDAVEFDVDGREYVILAIKKTGKAP